MGVMFSKVTLTADNGSVTTLLCSGLPKDHYDLEDWTNYQKFMSDNLDSKSVKAEVDTISTAKARFISLTFTRSPRLPAEANSSFIIPMCIGREALSFRFIRHCCQSGKQRPKTGRCRKFLKLFSLRGQSLFEAAYPIHQQDVLRYAETDLRNRFRAC